MALLLVVVLFGCAERKMTVTSDPPGALVFVDGVEKGITPVTFPFNFYGGRRFVLKRDGYQTLEEIRTIQPPLHMRFPLDTITDLTPIPGRDHKHLHFELKKLEDVDKEALLKRAEAFRERTWSEADLRLKKLGKKPPHPPRP